MDPREEQAQRLFWEIELLRSQNAERAVLPRLRKMAELHQERAWELLSARDPDGWTDLYAAITAWGEAGLTSKATQLISQGRQVVDQYPDGQKNLNKQLDELRAWLDALPVVPSLSDFDRPLPRIPEFAA